MVDPEIATTEPISKNEDPQHDIAEESNCDKVNGMLYFIYFVF